MKKDELETVCRPQTNSYFSAIDR